MKRTRRNHSAEFKARIAREALRGVKTVAEIARENSLHPVQVSGWKKELEENMSRLFERKGCGSVWLSSNSRASVRPSPSVSNEPSPAAKLRMTSRTHRRWR